MPAFKITVAYDGGPFVGWQRQAEGTSVQGLIEDALKELDGRDVAVHGAGRTDAGVHALGQVAGFTLVRDDITADVIVRSLNAKLPHEIRVLSAEPVAADFHARFSAKFKTYRYRLWTGDVLNPFERAYAWHVFGALDIGAMAEAARLVEGRHDFAAFQTDGSGRPTERLITASTFSTNGQGLATYDVTGNGFLRHMVRAIVGTLVEIGRGRRPPESMRDVIASRDRSQAGPNAPAQGLFLVSVDYGVVQFDAHVP
jgi:tRNA pseudouridine38-40 synthase